MRVVRLRHAAQSANLFLRRAGLRLSRRFTPTMYELKGYKGRFVLLRQCRVRQVLSHGQVAANHPRVGRSLSALLPHFTRQVRRVNVCRVVRTRRFPLIARRRVGANRSVYRVSSVVVVRSCNVGPRPYKRVRLVRPYFGVGCQVSIFVVRVLRLSSPRVIGSERIVSLLGRALRRITTGRTTASNCGGFARGFG